MSLKTGETGAWHGGGRDERLSCFDGEVEGFAPSTREPGRRLQRRIAYVASARRFAPSMVRNALRAIRRRRRRAFNTRIFHPIGS